MAINERITKNIKIKKWEGSFPVQYLYTYGIAGERFFREIKDKAKFLGTKCDKCSKVYIPPRIYCEDCMSRLEKWQEVKNTGIIESFTLAYLDKEGNRREKPRIIAKILLEGGYGGLIHFVDGISPEEIKIGMKVQAVFKNKKERVGSILDIKYFKSV